MGNSADSYLGDFYSKRKRAQVHFEALREKVQTSNAKTDTNVGVYNHDRHQYLFHCRVRAIDPDWSVMLGDVVYNARAALDYLITALVLSNGGTDDYRSEFPILGGDVLDGGVAGSTAIEGRWDEDPKSRIKRKLANTPEGTKDALKPLQPFYRAPQTNPALHPLHHLRLLSNRDKHRRLNLLAHVAAIEFVDQSGRPLYPGGAQRVKEPEADASGSYTVSLTKEQESPEDISLTTKATIHLDEPPYLVGELIGTVKNILDYLDSEVVPTVKRLF